MISDGDMSESAKHWVGLTTPHPSTDIRRSNLDDDTASGDNKRKQHDASGPPPFSALEPIRPEPSARLGAIAQFPLHSGRRWGWGGHAQAITEYERPGELNEKDEGAERKELDEVPPGYSQSREGSDGLGVFWHDAAEVTDRGGGEDERVLDAPCSRTKRC